MTVTMTVCVKERKDTLPVMSVTMTVYVKERKYMLPARSVTMTVCVSVSLFSVSIFYLSVCLSVCLSLGTHIGTASHYPLSHVAELCVTRAEHQADKSRSVCCYC